MFGFMKKKGSEAEPNNAAADNHAPESVADDDHGKQQSTFVQNTSKAAKNRYKNDFKDSGGLESQTTEELEQYAVHKAEETTDTVNNCLRIAEDIRGDATKTLETLHQQGEQIHRTHEMVVTTEQDLHKGEKLLGNLGGMFSKTWKPKKTKHISGPKTTPEPSSKAAKKEQKQKLTQNPQSKDKKGSKAAAGEPATCYDKIEMEKNKQDDALDDLSGILGDLKGMAVDMGTELDKQNSSLENLSEDVDELNSRMKGANERARKLAAK